MQPQQFKIEGYELENSQITVMLEKYNIAMPITIPQDRFEWWLRLNKKLEWEISAPDLKLLGNMTLDEYYKTDDQHIKQDLYSYITGNPITREGVLYTNSMESIMLAFDLHNAQRINPLFNTRWEHEQEIFEQLFN